MMSDDGIHQSSNKPIESNLIPLNAIHQPIKPPLTTGTCGLSFNSKGATPNKEEI